MDIGFACEYVGMKNFALKQPVDGISWNTGWEGKWGTEFVNDGNFPVDAKNFITHIWYGNAKWAYIQIDLGKSIAIKHSIFQSR